MIRGITHPAPQPFISTQRVNIKGFQTSGRFLSRACLFLLGLLGLAVLTSVLSFQAEKLRDWLILLLLLGISGVVVVAWQCARRDKLLVAAWLLVVTMIVGNTTLFLIGSDASFPETLSVFMLGAILAMLTLGGRVAFAVVLWGNLATTGLLLTDGIYISKNAASAAARLGFDDLSLLITIQLLTIWLVNYLVKRLTEANRITEAQATQLLDNLAETERKRQLGEETSQRVLSLSAELHATANQQSNGSNSQMKALAEVITFIEELTQTSQVIAGEANQLKEATEIISSSTGQASAANLAVKQMSESSARAVKQTTQQNQQVNELYRALGTTLAQLAQSQTEIRKVVTLIRDLGNQTHLLALNAALEAAAAGEHGKRFGVVAQAVKAQARRSIEASLEVSQILGVVESRIIQATEEAESGYMETQAALTIAQDSSALMRQLISIIEHSNAEMERIERAASLMNTQASEISVATKQQYTASIQGVEKLQIIGTIATQTATGSSQVTSSTSILEELARDLHLALQ